MQFVGRWIIEKRRHIRFPTAQRLEQPVGWGAAEDATWPEERVPSGVCGRVLQAWAEPVEGAG